MSPFLPSRPGGRIRSLAVGVLLAVAALLAAPAAGVAGTARSGGAVDVAANTVLVTVPAGRGAAFVAKARTFGAAVRVERSPAVRPQAFYGGQAILHGGSRCSAGFNTRSGSGRNYVLTAGHCTNLGGTWTTSGGQTIGPVAASSFPG